MLPGIGEFLIAALITALIVLILKARYLPVLRRLEAPVLAAKKWRARPGMNPQAVPSGVRRAAREIGVVTA